MMTDYVPRKPLRRSLVISNSGQRAGSGGGYNGGGQWSLINDTRGTEVVLEYIEKGLVFNDPRRPDLIMFYIQETERRRKLAEQGVAEAERPAGLDLPTETSSSTAPLQVREDASLKVCRGHLILPRPKGAWRHCPTIPVPL